MAGTKIQRCWNWLFKCPEQQPKPTARFWRPFNWFFNCQILAAALGGAAVFVILNFFYSNTRPPGVDVVISLMKQEVTAAQYRDTALVRHIYTPDAVVTDAACGSPVRSVTWQGWGPIDVRYRGLPEIPWMQHVFEQVNWYPSDSSASTAYVRADTVGVMRPTARAKLQSISGRELWSFARVDGQWRITSFTYNLCLPPSLAG